MTVAKCTERLGLAEAGIGMSGDIYWKEFRAPVTRQEYMGMLAYF
jgi:hypothetical protein